MNFPLVTRRAYDLLASTWEQAERRHDREIEALMAELEAARKQASDLTETLCRMKLQGAEPVKYGHEDVPPPKTADPVRLAIREQVKLSGGDKGLEAHLRNYARELKFAGKSPEQIAKALGKWESSEDLSAPQDSVVPVEA